MDGKKANGIDLGAGYAFARERIPNFFIVGAPKCGTTSLASWLSEHENIFMTKYKEPHFFSRDIRTFNKPRDFEQYARLFSEVSNPHDFVGEASTTYLMSKVAPSLIMKYRPKSKIIVCLRDPVEMAISVHGQHYKKGRENVASFETAWRLQSKRAEGLSVPKQCPDAQLLLYGSICKLGEQMESLFDRVPRKQVLTVFLDDIKCNPISEYERVLTFLGAPRHSRTNFPVFNERQIPRFLFIARILHSVRIIKEKTGIGRRGLGIARKIVRMNLKKDNRPEIPPRLLSEMRAYYSEDVTKLESLLGRDLSNWRSLKVAEDN